MFHEDFRGDDWKMGEITVSEEVAEWLGWKLLEAAELRKPEGRATADVLVVARMQ